MTDNDTVILVGLLIWILLVVLFLYINRNEPYDRSGDDY